MRFDVAGAIVRDVSSTVFASEVSKSKSLFRTLKTEDNHLIVDCTALEDFDGCQAHFIYKYVSHGKEKTSHGLIWIVC